MSNAHGVEGGGQQAVWGIGSAAVRRGDLRRTTAGEKAYGRRVDAVRRIGGLLC
ncbi:MAG: hypothetical protein IJV22_09745 [Bacteroidales bacterium]|nr:hypothetical protein [Bacteroidales bacterium]